MGLQAKRKVVKIGNGNMILQNKLKHLNLKFCSSFELEFVDEKNTSLKIKNFNQRGNVICYLQNISPNVMEQDILFAII